MSNKTAEQYRQEGNQHAKHNRLQDALHSYSKAILHNPNDYITYSNRAKIYLDLGQYENALNDSECSIARDGTFWKGYHRKATSLMMLKRLDEAMEVCSNALVNLPSGEGLEAMNKLKEQIEKRRMSSEEKNNKESKLDQVRLSRIELKERILGVKLNAFFKSIVENDCTALKKLLDAGQDVNEKMKVNLQFTSSADGLLAALATESKEAFELLLNSGCTYDKKSDLPFKYNIFHIVCTTGNADFLSVLLDKLEIDCESSSTKEKTVQFITTTFFSLEAPCYSPLLVAIFTDSVECIKLIYDSHLVKSGIIDREKLSKLQVSGQTLLHLIADRGSCKTLRFIIENGIVKYLDVNGQDNVGDTPLHSAALGNRLASIDMGSHKISNPILCDHSSDSCVHSQVIDVLASELGADLFIQNKEKRTPLAQSIFYGHHQCTQTLIEVGSLSKSQHSHEECYTLTGLACLRGHSKCLQILLDNNVKAANDSLHNAIVDGFYNCCKILLDRNAISDINFAWSFDNKDPKNTPLTLACLVGNLDIVKLLLSYKKQSINVNVAPPKVTLPLHIACLSNRHAVVSHLLSIGADPLLIDCEGNSVLTAAAYKADGKLFDIIFPYLGALAKKSNEHKVKVLQLMMHKTRKENMTCIEIAAHASNLDAFDALLRHFESYGIMIKDVEKLRKKIEEHSKKKQQSTQLPNSQKEDPSLSVESPVPSKNIKNTIWEDLSESAFQQKMKELLEKVTLYIGSEVPQDLVDILDEFMIDNNALTRLCKNNLEMGWYDLLFKPNLKEQPQLIIISMVSNIFIFMNESKKSKIKNSKQSQNYFAKLLFSKERMNNLKILAAAFYCFRHLYIGTVVDTAAKLPGGSLGALRNNGLILLLNGNEKEQVAGATILQDITVKLTGRIDLIYHHHSRIKSIDGFKIIVSLLNKHLDSGLKLIIANGAEVMLSALGAAAWDFPKDILESGAIEVAEKYIDNLEYIDTATAENALSIFFGILQNVNPSTKRNIERKYKLSGKLLNLLKDLSRGANFSNYLIRSLALLLNFKTMPQSEKENTILLTVRSMQHFMPPGTKTFNEDQVALGRHASVVLGTACSNDSRSTTFLLDNTDKGLAYYISLFLKAPIRLQSNLVSVIIVSMSHTDFPNLLDKYDSNSEYVLFMNWVQKNALSNDQQKQYICMMVLQIIGALHEGRIPNVDFESETEEKGKGFQGPHQPSCAFCANQPCKSKCGECKQTPYCSRECQLADWNFHKFVCKKPSSN
ncbi:predicted protein [Naegleria gruberi]|uniref:Predicted protein n=1 Tax=Naegleria gruberi TaxID=5762 RepID=D2VFV7_NAEGR|nr:uncharacterized protein NAEGRDRAFT_67759 [Naegleria gruberi]EFC44254.1 predicted protein [Naegleria gruberi]|eukprot:XP_002676998.1 predicted protein [Naegleria gruberi strain NEG-M]